MKKQVGDYLYTVNKRFKRIYKWEILNIEGNQYYCKDADSNDKRYFFENSNLVFDSKADALKGIKRIKAIEKIKIAIPLILILAVCAILFFNGTFF
jgi:hypothetical protein